jgi:peroxiredoxin
MRTLSILAGLAAALVVGAACAQSGVSGATSNSKAPDFSAKGSDGKTYTLKALTEKKPVFLYFVKRDCGSNPTSVPLFTKLYKAYEGKVNFLAVSNADADGYKGFVSDFGAPFVGILDPQKEIIHAYGIRASQTVVMVNPDGSRKKFGGFGREALKDLNASMAAAAGVPVKSIDLSDAPNGVAFG